MSRSVQQTDARSDGVDDPATCDGGEDGVFFRRTPDQQASDSSSNSTDSLRPSSSDDVIAPDQVVSLNSEVDAGRDPDVSAGLNATKSECRKKRARRNLATEPRTVGKRHGDGGDKVLFEVDVCDVLVFALSRELAFFCNLSLGLGGTGDSDRLREELRHSRHRVCALARRNRHALIPLLKRKAPEQCANNERAELEKLYRVYSGCLEYLEIQLHKVSNLQTIFPLHTGDCILINTGIVDPTLSKSTLLLNADSRSPTGSCSPLQPAPSTTEGAEEIEKIKRELGEIKQLLYHVSSSVDIQPWDVEEPHGDFTRQRRMWVYVVCGVAMALLVIGIVVGVTVFMMAD
ncbi:hypothetical protein BaRGS_00036797 [Batillaria attramentaria]|uniref:Uncharacterized protein n=1 Tax=Batillaria attramentaria TaxID=370345 RepID=A0ABD0JAQ8_9CAEN